MQYKLILTGKFKKSLKLAKKRGLCLELLDKVLKEKDVLTLTLVDTGTHADLFNL